MIVENEEAMRKIICLLLVLISTMSQAQVYSKYNTKSIYAIVYYQKGTDGFYHKSEHISINEINESDIKKRYAYDKKNNKLYLETKYGNFIVEPFEYESKKIKKDESIPKLKENEIQKIVLSVNMSLSAFFEKKNAEYQEQLNQKKAKEKEDSLRSVREDSLRKVQEQEKKEKYRNTHKFNHVPVLSGSLYCRMCEKSITVSDTIITFAANRDSIVWIDELEGDLGLSYFHVHKAAISYGLKNYEPYKYHYTVFSDSLNSRYNDIEPNELEGINSSWFYKHMLAIKNVAPNGYFLDWGWDSEYSSISFHFRYMNTNKNTIKYIEVLFVVTNDVGDIRKTGSFKGTGPLEEWESASWNWDHSSYYVAGDASKMNISKVIITYTNGTRVTIPKNKLRFN